MSDASGGGQAGSIPARAGEPASSAERGCFERVHPRASGGASRTGWRRSGAGVHPRASGGAAVGLDRWRHAEGPSPRERGSRHADRTPALLGGPSPRERGSRRLGGRRPAGVGSIPARAGEPELPCRTTIRRVHPRASGGAFGSGAGAYDPGPSPRERGSHARCLDARSRRVHPRASGGAGSASAPASAVGGPSPRERGSLVAGRSEVHVGGPSPRERGSLWSLKPCGSDDVKEHGVADEITLFA